MYDAKTQLLIENPLNRYLINSPMLPDLKTNEDGSLTIYVQKDSPGKEKESNWLSRTGWPYLCRDAVVLAEGMRRLTVFGTRPCCFQQIDLDLLIQRPGESCRSAAVILKGRYSDQEWVS